MGVGQDSDRGREFSGALRMGDPGRAEEVLRENQDRTKARVTKVLGVRRWRGAMHGRRAWRPCVR